MSNNTGVFRSKDGSKVGEWEVAVDQKLKLVKIVTKNKMEFDGMKECFMGCAMGEFKKFNKGEPLYLLDMANCDTKFMSAEMMAITREFADFLQTHCKRSAIIITSFVLRKAAEIFNAGTIKYFGSEREAMQFLLKD